MSITVYFESENSKPSKIERENESDSIDTAGNVQNNVNPQALDDNSDTLKNSFQSFVFPIHPQSEFPDQVDSVFVGRSSLKINLTGALVQSEETGGCFLVGGYRGVGKSLLVNEVVGQYKEKVKAKNKDVIDIPINISDAKILNFRGVMTDSISSLLHEVKKLVVRKNTHFLLTLQAVMAILFVCLAQLNFDTGQYRLLQQLLVSGDSINFGVEVIKGALIFVISAIYAWLAYLSLHRAPTTRTGFLTIYGKLLAKFSKMKNREYCFKYLLKCTKSLLKYCIFVTILLIVPVAYLIIYFDYTAINYSHYILVVVTLIPPLLITIRYRKLNILKKRLDALLNESRYEEEFETGSTLKSTIVSFSGKKRKKKNQLSDREIENEFLSILAYSKSFLITLFIFDELDKLGDRKVQGQEGGKRDLIDEFLGRMKSFLKTKNSRFIFIGDREIVDNYHSESGSKNALYEGIFDQIFYVPSLLSDYSDRRPDVLHSMLMEYLLNILLGSENLKQFYTSESFAHIEKYSSVVNRSAVMQKYYISWALTGSLSEKNIDLEDIPVENVKNYQYILNRFVRFLTVHSWGNYRRLIVLINQFVEQPTPENYIKHSDQCVVKPFYMSAKADFHRNFKDESPSRKEYKRFIQTRTKSTEKINHFLKDDFHYLHIDKKEMARILLSANMYEMIAWEMSSKLAGSDDKLIISTINSSVDLVKFHEVPFSRSYLDRTSEGIDIHAEPHLTSSIGDIIDKVNYPFIRKVRRGLFEYRFFSQHEEEIKYISKTVGAKASNYIFGLSSYDNVKLFYQSQLDRYISTEQSIENSGQGRAVIDMILGDINVWERSYDKAFSHYSDAIATLKKILRNPEQSDWRHEGGPSFSSHYYLSRVLLKKGLMLEIRRSYTLAWRFYREAIQVAQESLGQPYAAKGLRMILTKIYDKGEDVRHRDVLVLAMLALNTVYIKAGQVQRKEIDDLQSHIPFPQTDKAKETYSKIPFIAGVDAEIVYQHQISRYFSNDFNSITNELKGFINGFLKSESFKKINEIEGEKFIEDIDFTSSLTLVTWLQSTLILSLNRLLDEKKNSNYRKALRNILFPKFFDANNVPIEMTFKNIEHYIDNYELTLDKLVSDDAEVFDIIAYFKFYDLVAQSLIKLGYKVRASHVYSNIILVYLAIVESYPWNETFYIYDEKEYEGRFNKPFLNFFLKKHAKANQVHDQGLYKYQKDTWEFQGKDEQLDYTSTKEVNDFKTKISQELKQKNLTIWHHSHAKNLNLIMSFWYWQGLSNIQDVLVIENSTDTEGNLFNNDLLQHVNTENVLPQYQKNLSLLFWLKGRFHLKKAGNDSSAENKRDIQQALLYLYKAYEHTEKISGSGGTVSWPPMSLVMFNMLQALEKSVKIYDPKNRVDLIYKLEEDMNALIPRNFLDVHCIYILIKNACDDLKGITRTDSSFFKRQLQNKYFLYDDFKDPVFKIEWMFLHVLQNGSDAHFAQAKIIKSDIDGFFENKVTN